MNLALFDFDGTLTREDSFLPFVRSVTSRRRMLVGTAVLSPLIGAYYAKLLPATHMRASIVRLALLGAEAERVRFRGARFAAEWLPSVTREWTMTRLRWHQDRGDRVAIVSASLDAYLGPYCDALGVDRICTELETEQGVLTGRYKGGDCSGEEKAKRVRARYDLATFVSVHAYGDTDEDAQLLQLANHRYLRGEPVLDGRSVS